MRVAPEIVLTNEERAELSKLVRSRRTSVRLAQRARIVLLAADGMWILRDGPRIFSPKIDKTPYHHG